MTEDERDAAKRAAPLLPYHLPRGNKMENKNKSRGRAVALLPIGIFLVIFLGAGIIFEDFSAMPAIVAFLIALFSAFLQNRS